MTWLGVYEAVFTNDTCSGHEHLKMYFQLWIWICCMLSLVHAISVDNGIEGSPEVTCGDTFIGLQWRTRNPFEGYAFVREHFGESACRSGENATGRRDVQFKVPFTACGLQKTRSGNPKGVFAAVQVVVSFHPRLITKIDRIYDVQCFYMEAVKEVTAELEVSMLTTSLQTQTAPMPVCRYEVLEGSLNGPPVKYAKIGDQVYHKWTCDTNTVDTFCMVVHSCTVEDGQGTSVPLIDPNGCAQDKYLLGNLDYIGDLTAGKESHVFKYADRSSLFFNCQVSIVVREPGQLCPKPRCQEPKRGKRRARDLATTRDANENDAAEITISDLHSAILIDASVNQENSVNGTIEPAATIRSSSITVPRAEPGRKKGRKGISDDLCMSLLGFSIYVGSNVLMPIVSLILFAIAINRSKKCQ